jgi:secreted trypsin-like serine protease
VAAFKHVNRNIIFCGGSIISFIHVITAAHCLINERNNYRNVRIYTGITHTHSLGGQESEIARAFIHPWFTGEKSEDGVNQHDVAIVLVYNF